MTFWKKLHKPIIGLSPMDGVTDAAFRYVIDEIGKPAVIFTEFVPVEAIKANAQRVLDAFVTHNTKAYYLSTLVVCELGFDGVDINMGCPAKSVQSRGAGAGLIKNPELARQVIKTVKKAAADYANGAYKSYSVPSDIKQRVSDIKMKEKQRSIPISVSVKTRIGYEQNNVKDWISEIAQEKLDCITVHGRTYIQMYRGVADWDAISDAAKVVKKLFPGTIFLGNGDVKNLSQVSNICDSFGVDGVLIGGAALGNPWIFSGVSDKKISKEEIFKTMLLHANKFNFFYPKGHFFALRKHMLWYTSGFEGARKMHEELQKMKDIKDLQQIILLNS